LTRYDHGIDRLIVNELNDRSLTCTDLCDSLKKLHEAKKIRYATVWEHLTRLCDAGIIQKSCIPGENNERPYSLTSATECQLEYDIFEGVESKRENPAKREETQQRKNSKILTLLLLQAASGSSRWKVAQKIEPGLVGNRNPETGKFESLESYNEKGVTTMDIVRSRDHSNAGIFSHINFNESDVQKYYDKLVNEDKDFVNIIAKDVRQDGEIQFFIDDRMLCNLIMSCSALLSDNRIEDTLKLVLLKSSKKLMLSNSSSKSIRHSRFIHDAFEWYISLFGQKRFNRLSAQTRVVQMKCRLNNEDTYRRFMLKAFDEELEYGLSNEDVYDRLYAMMVKEEESIIATESTRLGKRRRKEGKKKLKEQIQRIEESIRMWDESILHGYHCRILCDKYERGYTEKYRKFVRNMPNRYSLLRDMLVDTFYPEFLRKEHKRNPELVKYVNGFGQLSHLDGSSSSVK